MQHPEEAKIHEWLDDALSPDEASAVSAHIAECAECQPRVAEARGLIAGASRILNSLDNVPTVAIPAAKVSRPLNRQLLQAAAMLALVTGVGALFTRTQFSEPSVKAPASVVSRAHTIEESAPTESNAPPVRESRIPPVAHQTAAAPQSAVRLKEEVTRSGNSDLRSSAVTDMASAPVVAGSANEVNVSAAPVSAAAAVGNAASSGSLKIIRTEQSAQESRTFYELAPDRVVVLVENGTAKTGDGVAAVAAMAAQAMPRGGIAKGVVGGSTAPSARLKSVASDTIRWVDESGKRFVLYGPFSIAELSDLKQRIQALRRAH